MFSFLNLLKHKVLLCLACCILVVGCDKQSIFKGKLCEIHMVGDEVMVKADSVDLEHPHGFFFSVADTLAVFFTPSQSGDSYEIVNLKTGCPIGNFIPCGHGSGEFIAVSTVEQLYEEDNQLKAFMTASNEQKLICWNISQSLSRNTTVLDAVECRKSDEQPAYYRTCYYVGADSVMTYYGSRIMQTTEGDVISEPVWQLRSLSKNSILKEFRLYQPVYNNAKASEGTVSQDMYYYTYSCVKPDFSKIAEAMDYLPQINVIDIKNGDVKGFLMTGREDYSIFMADMKEAHSYYKDVQSDDRYIFALWSGMKITEDDFSRGYDEVHVFDWNGRMLKKVKLSVPVQSIYLDQANDLLYGCHQDRQPLYRYKVADMGL
ncbi:MAG: hypothetical protein ACI350_07890 [Prevotella sp.]